MKNIIISTFVIFFSIGLFGQADQVALEEKNGEVTLLVNGEPFMMNGMNWDYFPIGSTNPSYNFWNKSDDFIKAALDHEMSMLRNMGVNVIRQYTGVTPRWVEYIYENYGIYTMINHTFGRYGVTIDGAYVPITDYADPKVREILIADAKAMVEDFKGTPGILMYMLGNENNYGLFWDGAETEDVPMEDRRSTLRAYPMYKLFNDAAIEMKKIDPDLPIAMCNGDLLFLDIIAEECKDIDIFGTNVYRGISFGDLFDRVKNELGKPVLFAEFGSDAFNAIENQEDQKAQAYYMVGNWKEIYENAAGLGKAGNSIGGFTFQFSDGWWKYGQTDNLDIHDNNASWVNGGYRFDFKEGENNMNEEWFGVCAKGPTSPRGLYDLYPRAAYYALQEAHRLDPYSPGTTLESIGMYFSDIQLMDAVLKARGDNAALDGEQIKKIRVSELRAELSMFSTGGNLISTPDNPVDDENTFPNQLGFDHMESYYIGIEANPTPSMRANVSFNFLGNVATVPINEIFYENRGRARTVDTDEGDLLLGDINRFQVYQGELSWKGKDFDVEGFYRTGHYHWGYEGDFFGLYPEANYGPNIDLYNGEAPFGFEVTGKRGFDGLKVAFGPELWWGANPAILVKYQTNLGKWDVTGIFHEDVDNAGASVSSFAIPQPTTRRATIHLERDFGKLGFEIGGIWGGKPLVGREFQLLDEDDPTNTTVYVDEIQDKDTWGGKFKLTYEGGRFNWYAQGSAKGLVAFGGGDYTQTFTGWKLKDYGSGNVMNLFSGFTYSMGNLQVGPNFMMQKPFVGPIPGGVDAPGRPRNILDDPFVVRSNRETVAGEILFTYDPTPGTWMYQWDNDMVEDATFAMSAGFVFRHFPTTQDAAIGILANGRTLFAFPGAAPAEDLWEVHARFVTKLSPKFGFITNIYGGEAQANGSDERLIERFGGDVRMIYDNIKLTTEIKVNDWGPYDYHRDFNLTFPLQLMADLSTSLSKGSWLNLPSTRMGISGIFRTLNEFSPRYCPTSTVGANGMLECDPEAPGFGNGREWQFRTYFFININN